MATRLHRIVPALLAIGVAHVAATTAACGPSDPSKKVGEEVFYGADDWALSLDATVAAEIKNTEAAAPRVYDVCAYFCKKSLVVGEEPSVSNVIFYMRKGSKPTCGVFLNGRCDVDCMNINNWVLELDNKFLATADPETETFPTLKYYNGLTHIATRDGSERLKCSMISKEVHSQAAVAAFLVFDFTILWPLAPWVRKYWAIIKAAQGGKKYGLGFLLGVGLIGIGLLPNLVVNLASRQECVSWYNTFMSAFLGILGGLGTLGLSCTCWGEGSKRLLLYRKASITLGISLSIIGIMYLAPSFALTEAPNDPQAIMAVAMLPNMPEQVLGATSYYAVGGVPEVLGGMTFGVAAVMIALTAFMINLCYVGQAKSDKTILACGCNSLCAVLCLAPLIGAMCVYGAIGVKMLNPTLWTGPDGKPIPRGLVTMITFYLNDIVSTYHASRPVPKGETLFDPSLVGGSIFIWVLIGGLTGVTLLVLACYTFLPGARDKDVTPPKHGWKGTLNIFFDDRRRKNFVLCCIAVACGLAGYFLADYLNKGLRLTNTQVWDLIKKGNATANVTSERCKVFENRRSSPVNLGSQVQDMLQALTVAGTALIALIAVPRIINVISKCIKGFTTFGAHVAKLDEATHKPMKFDAAGNKMPEVGDVDVEKGMAAGIAKIKEKAKQALLSKAKKHPKFLSAFGEIVDVLSTAAALVSLFSSLSDDFTEMNSTNSSCYYAALVFPAVPQPGGTRPQGFTPYNTTVWKNGTLRVNEMAIAPLRGSDPIVSVLSSVCSIKYTLLLLVVMRKLDFKRIVTLPGLREVAKALDPIGYALAEHEKTALSKQSGNDDVAKNFAKAMDGIRLTLTLGIIGPVLMIFVLVFFGFFVGITVIWETWGAILVNILATLGWGCLMWTLITSGFTPTEEKEHRKDTETRTLGPKMGGLQLGWQGHHRSHEEGSPLKATKALATTPLTNLKLTQIEDFAPTSSRFTPRATHKYTRDANDNKVIDSKPVEKDEIMSFLKSLEKIDKNKDGKVSKAELEEWRNEAAHDGSKEDKDLSRKTVARLIGRIQREYGELKFIIFAIPVVLYPVFSIGNVGYDLLSTMTAMNIGSLKLGADAFAYNYNNVGKWPDPTQLKYADPTYWINLYSAIGMQISVLLSFGFEIIGLGLALLLSMVRIDKVQEDDEKEDLEAAGDLKPVEARGGKEPDTGGGVMDKLESTKEEANEDEGDEGEGGEGSSSTTPGKKKPGFSSRFLKSSRGLPSPGSKKKVKASKGPETASV
jgi:hypothetical protein